MARAIEITKLNTVVICKPPIYILQFKPPMKSHTNTTYEITSKSYVTLFRTGWHLLDMAEKHAEGSLLNLNGAAVFLAFSFEAYLNHVGAEEISFWNEIERISHSQKLLVLSKHLKFKADNSCRPFQTLKKLFELRNGLAHGRTQAETVVVKSRGKSADGAAWRLLPWEKLSSDSVRRIHDDLKECVQTINDSRPHPDDRLWNEGTRSYDTSTS